MESLLDNLRVEFEDFSFNATLQNKTANKAAGSRARVSSRKLTLMLKDFRRISVEKSKINL